VSCSGDVEDRVSSDEDEATAAVRSAVAETFRSSGRFTLSFENDDLPDMAASGEFDEGGVSAEYRGDGQVPVKVLSVGGTTYVDLNSNFGGMIDSSTPGLEGKTWMQVPDEDSLGGFTGSPGLGADLAPGMLLSMADLADRLEAVTNVTADGTETVDGIVLSRFRADLRPSDLNALLASDGSPGIEDTAEDVDDFDSKLAALSKYLDDHSTVRVSVLTNERRVRRVTFELTSKVEAQYQGCWYFAMSTSDSVIVVDLTDRGSAVTITPPDPSTVVTFDELMSTDAGFGGEDDGSFIDTVDGGWPRPDLIDLVAEDAERIGLDPDAIAGLSDQDLAARYNEILQLDGPFLQTSDGGWSRTDIEGMLRDGASDIGLDPTTIPSLSDADLVARYDEMVLEQDGDTFMADDEMFAGCPT